MKNNTFIRQLGEYFETYLPSVRRVSPNTIAAYADSFAILFQFLLDAKQLPHYRATYKTFDAALFDEYMIWLGSERNYSDSSIRQRLTAISAFLKYASRREMSALPAYSAMTNTKPPSIRQNAFPYFTVDEMNILTGLPDPNVYLGKRDLVLLSFLYDTAARAQELCDIDIGDLRFGKPTKIKLNGKGKKTREVPLSAEVSNLLRYHLKNTCSERDSPLFLSQSNERMTTACVRSIVLKYVAIAKTNYPKLFPEKKYSPHSFRHSKAVHMVESGVSLINIRNFLGHESISSTEIYARIGQEAVTKALTNRNIPRISIEPPILDDGQTLAPMFISDARKLHQ